MKRKRSARLPVPSLPSWIEGNDARFAVEHEANTAFELRLRVPVLGLLGSVSERNS